MTHNDLVALIERVLSYHTDSAGLSPEIVADKPTFIAFLDDIECHADELKADLKNALTALRSGEAVLCNGKALSSFGMWWAMCEAENELSEEPPIPDNAVILHYMGCGASHQVTAGDIRAMLDCAQGSGNANT